MTSEQRFCDVLTELIAESEMSNSEFYTALGIKKAYFYDIIKGRVNAPPPEKQLSMARILKIPSEKLPAFFDAAARERDEVPVDIRMQLEDLALRTQLRAGIKYDKLLEIGDCQHG